MGDFAFNQDFPHDAAVGVAFRYHTFPVRAISHRSLLASYLADQDWLRLYTLVLEHWSMVWDALLLQ